MKIFPAIDLYEKKAVRLYKGDYKQMSVYSNDPVATARDFKSLGAEYIHMVDLEGARDGTTPNLEIVERVSRELGLFTQIGGGIRSMETIKRYLDSGVSRVILGTAAVENMELLNEAVSLYSERIAVGADVKDGYIAVKGWLEKSAYTLDNFLEKMQNVGVKTVVCTDISRDGAMGGANLSLYGKLSKRYNMDIVASGGVASMEDIRRLREIGLYGAIVGKAYYTGAIDLREAIEVAR